MNQEIKQKIEELQESIQKFSERQNAQYTDIMLQLKNLQDQIVQHNDIDNRSEDDLYDEAKKLVIEARKASTSFLQRKLRIGYARACGLIDMLEENEIIDEGEGAKPRNVLVQKEN